MRDVTKLPKWAQDEIKRLTADVEWWKGKATAGPEDSDTFVRNLFDSDTPLGQQPRIKFQLGKSWGQYIEVRKDGDGVLIHGADSIRIVPQASNAIRIKLDRS